MTLFLYQNPIFFFAQKHEAYNLIAFCIVSYCAMPLEDDFSSQESDHESGDEDNADPNDSPMMSIFASYYGIEDTETDNKPKGTIDDVNFEPDAYVKVKCV